MRKSRKIISMPIISIVEGVQIGSVKGLVINPEKKEVAALIVDQKGWFREEKIIPYNKVAHVGDDAITIDQSANVEKPANLPEILRFLREKTSIVGMKVISERGKVIGHIDEFYIDEETGKIVSLEISGKFIEGLLKGKGLLDAGEIKTIGTDAVVVKTGTEDKVTKIDGGLQETIANFKDSTSSLWNTTRQKTIELSKSIKEKTKEKVKNVRKEDSELPEDQEVLSEDTVASSEKKDASTEDTVASSEKKDASTEEAVEAGPLPEYPQEAGASPDSEIQANAEAPTTKGEELADEVQQTTDSLNEKEWVPENNFRDPEDQQNS